MIELQAIADFIFKYQWYAIFLGVGLFAWYVLKALGGEYVKQLSASLVKLFAERTIERIDLSDNTRDYLKQAIIAYSRFKFHGLPTHVAKNDANRLSLDQAYVSLRVMPQHMGEMSDAEGMPEMRTKAGSGQLERMAKSESINLPQALTELKKRRLAVIGIAGSGKSTLLQWAGLACARSMLGEKLNDEQRELINALGGKTPFPIFISLRAYNEYCKQNNKTRSLKSLLDFFSAYFSEDQASCEFSADFFKLHIQKNCLLMFDGMDEVEPSDRDAIQKAVETFIESFEHPRLYCLISSRPSAAYASDRMTGFQRCEVQRLTAEQRGNLIRFWHGAVYTDSQSAGEKKASQLIQKIENASEPVKQLATTPLMVTIFCMVNYSSELPRLRAQLYEDAIAVLLTDTVHHEGDHYKGLEKWGGMEWQERRDRLAHIAFTLQEEGVIQKPEADLVELIWQEFGSEPKTARENAREFLSMVAQRGGLLEAMDNEYGFFTHATFQEYLAGRYLAAEIIEPKERMAFLQKHFMNDKWSEAIRLAAGYLSIGGKSPAYAFVDLLAGLGAFPAEKAQALALAGEALVDMRTREPKAAEQICRQIQKALEANPPYASVSLRMRLGLALGSLDDPRFAFNEPALCRVPAGEFRMGTSEEEAEVLKSQDVKVYDDEQPSQNVFVSEFFIGKYPVTNLEYAVFYESKGYENPDFWSKVGWDWRTGKFDSDLSVIEDKDLRKAYQSWLAGRPASLRDKPYFWDDPQWNAPNLPVVGISWFEAEAYCKWLSHVTSKTYRLPTEAEWEKAARGPKNLLWSWGDEWSGALCNNADQKTEEKLNRTSPVGMYPDGASGYGALDMMGNVWEWCADWYENLYSGRKDGRIADPRGAEAGVYRVVRGGSWDFIRYGVRCAVRRRLIPDVFNYFIGFRVALSPD